MEGKEKARDLFFGSLLQIQIKRSLDGSSLFHFLFWLDAMKLVAFYLLILNKERYVRFSFAYLVEMESPSFSRD